MPNIFAFGLLRFIIRKLKKKNPLFVPFLGVEPFVTYGLHLNNLNLLVPRMLHANLKSILSSGS